jgi:hypothetical protein
MKSMGSDGGATVAGSRGSVWLADEGGSDANRAVRAVTGAARMNRPWALEVFYEGGRSHCLECANDCSF